MKYIKPYLKPMLIANILGLSAFLLSAILFLDLTYIILGLIIVSPATLLSGILNALSDYLRNKSNKF